MREKTILAAAGVRARDRYPASTRYPPNCTDVQIFVRACVRACVRAGVPPAPFPPHTHTRLPSRAFNLAAATTAAAAFPAAAAAAAAA